uniref:EamA domain-containing protein n=1 Tax=Romanomermis culicivorax TaxID=13658 RepID=A0A915IIZ5_ROMCU
NALSVWIISRTGIALAALFCSFPQLLAGWLCGRFGLFGTKIRLPNNESLNILGLLLSLFSAILYAFVKQNSSANVESVKGQWAMLKIAELVITKDHLNCQNQMTEGGSFSSRYFLLIRRRLKVNQFMTPDPSSVYVGFSACVVSTIFFGSGFVPLKKIELKDANALSVWIISRTGIALAALFCSFPQLLAGWLCGRFGLFGTKIRLPNNESLNILGLLLSLFSAILYAFVKQNSSANVESVKGQWAMLKIAELVITKDHLNCQNQMTEGGSFSSRAIVASILAGLFYGFCFVPVIYMQDNWADAPKSSIPYMFSFYCGAFATSTVLFAVYSLVMSEAAFVQSKTVVPSLLCGIFRVISQTAFFLAIENLSETVTFPIITRFPSIITTLWGIIVFKEIQGKRNFIIVLIAVIVTLIGGLCSGLSKLL